MEENLDAEATIRKHLQPGEQLLWTGRPAQGVRLLAHEGQIRFAGFGFMGFSALWTALVVFFIIASIPEDWHPALLVGPPFGLLFFLVGHSMAIGRYKRAARRRAVTCYGLTDSRVIVTEGDLKRSIKLVHFRDMDLVPEADGLWSIGWGFKGRQYALTPMGISFSQPRQHHIELLADGPELFELIKQANATDR